MKATNQQIISKIELRKKNGQPLIYWREQTEKGEIRQAQFYWGDRATKKLNRVRFFLNNPGRGNRKKLAALIGLKLADISFDPAPDFGFRHDVLKNPDFVRKEIFQKLKNKEKSRVERLRSISIKQGLTVEQRRKRPSVARNLFSEFVWRAAGMHNLFDDLEKEEPMEQWPAYKLKEALETIRPMREWIARLDKLSFSNEATR